ncbi:hypothetical protein IH879_08140, partial [candidate division KSB1 bacterium]|nr:hypothetical protein [candidate division KSB1 bacterium]
MILARFDSGDGVAAVAGFEGAAEATCSREKVRMSTHAISLSGEPIVLLSLLSSDLVMSMSFNMNI